MLDFLKPFALWWRGRLFFVATSVVVVLVAGLKEAYDVRDVSLRPAQDCRRDRRLDGSVSLFVLPPVFVTDSVAGSGGARRSNVDRVDGTDRDKV